MDNAKNKPINFNVVRDFGQVFNITFVFLKQNFKGLMVAILSFVLPFSFIHGAMQGIMQMDLYAVFDFNPYYNSFPFAKFFAYYAIIIFLYVLSYAMMFVTVYGYVSLYIEKGHNNFTNSDVWARIRKDFLKTTGSFFVVILMIGFASGLFFFVLGLPGLYIFVASSFTFIILIYEKKGFGYALSRSFNLTHKKFWWTLLLVLVVFAMTWILNFILGLPNSIIALSIQFNQGSIESMQYIQIALTIITTTISIVFQLIPMLAIAFQYFSIVEEFEGKGLEQRINMIGKDNA